MDITPEKSLQVIVALVQRAPLTDAEALGAQFAVSKIEAALKELNDFKNPPKGAPTD